MTSPVWKSAMPAIIRWPPSTCMAELHARVGAAALAAPECEVEDHAARLVCLLLEAGQGAALEARCPAAGGVQTLAFAGVAGADRGSSLAHRGTAHHLFDAAGPDPGQRAVRPGAFACVHVHEPGRGLAYLTHLDGVG